MDNSALTFELIVRGSREAILQFMTSGAAITTLTAPPVHNTTAPATTNDDDGPANAAAPAVDSAGLPWDERIHSKNKNLNTNGTWRAKRGVDAALVASVEAELRGRAAPNVQPTYTPPTMQVTPPPPAYQPPPQYPTAPPAAYQPPQQHQMPPGYPQPGPAAPPPTGQPPLTLNSFMAHLTTLFPKRDANGQPVVSAADVANLAQYLSQQLGRPINHVAEVGDDANALNMAVNWLNSQGKWNV